MRGYRWWSWEIGTDQATYIPDQLPTSSYADRFVVDGRTFVSDNTLLGADGSADAPLTELLSNGELRRALTVKGQLGGMITRIR